MRCEDLSITVKTEANHDASHSNVGIVIKVVGQVTDRAQDSVPGGGGKAQRSEAFDRGKGRRCAPGKCYATFKGGIKKLIDGRAHVKERERKREREREHGHGI